MKTFVRTAIGKADDVADWFLGRIRTVVHANDDDAAIVPYVGHAGAGRIFLSGRVLRASPVGSPAAKDTRWRNLTNVYASFATREVPHARVRLTFRDTSAEATADKEGYFQAELAAGPLPCEPVWQSVGLELLYPFVRNPANARATADVLVPPPTARFAVISDIDDTIVATNVTSKVKLALTVLFSNAHTRVPFAGLPAFYRALRDGRSGVEQNPIFYVSNGPWNLYPLVIEFLRLNDIPLGPLFLRDFGEELLFAQDGAHKLARIEHLLATHPHLPFILIGDSGERDPEIYSEIVRRHPQRIRSIYIRSIDRSTTRIAAIERLIRQVSATHTQFVLVPDSEFAAVHAASENLIAADTVAAVRRQALAGAR